MESYFKSHDPNKFKPGHKTAYTIPDMLSKGQVLVYSTIADSTDTVGSGKIEAHTFMLEGKDLFI